MLAIGNDELAEPLGEVINCHICGKRHKLKRSVTKLKDGSTHKGTLSFFKCGKKTYLAGINGMALPGVRRAEK